MKLVGFVLVVSFGLCAFLLFYLGKVAKRVGLVDVPTSRKQHDQPIPLVGGLAIWMSLVGISLLASIPLGDYRILFFCVLLILVTGLLDDYREIGPTARITVQILGAFILVVLGESVVRSLGEVFFIAKPYGLGWAAVPFSVIAVVGTINAFNMSDGHDGLAGSFLLIVFGALTILSALSGSNYAGPLAVITVTLIPFLLFNLMSVVGRERQVFLGDAGSMSLGLLAAFFLIELSKAGTDVVKVTAAPWLIGLPLLDMVGVMVFRIKRKRSPFQSDRSHLHHLLVGIGWSKYRVLFVLVMVQLGFALVGVIGTFGNWNDGILMWGSFGMLLLYLGLVSRIRGHLGEG